MGFKVINPQSIKDFLDLSLEYGSNSEIRRIPLQRLLNMAEASDCKCQTLLIESDYEDNEYKKEFELFYNQVFACKKDAKCNRIHFFSTRFTPEQFNVNPEETIKVNEKAYLGYCTLRPAPYKTISDALISERLAIDAKTRFVFFTCSTTKKVNILNQTLNVCGFPYMQQDGRIAACAQAALSIISQYFFLNKKVDKKYTAPEITSMLSQKSSQFQTQRHIPTSGLSIIQIKMALEEMGFNPLAYDYSLKKSEELFLSVHPEQVIYRYIESGIPVIVGINTGNQRHALVIIGHTFNPDYWWSQAETLYYNIPKSGSEYHCSTNWIQNFIAQDDNLGPYLFVPSQILRDNTINCIIVPLEKTVFNPGEDAEKAAFCFISQDYIKNMMEQYLKHLSVKEPDSLNLYWLRNFLIAIGNKQLVLRSFLIGKSQFLEETIINHNKTVKDCYQKMHLPDNFWVIELSIPSVFCYSRLKLGEVLIDPTADAKSDLGFLSLHAPGLIIEKNVMTDKMEFKKIDGDDPLMKHRYRGIKPGD